MLGKIFIKMHTIRWFSKENEFICGSDIYDCLLKDIGTVMKTTKKHIKVYWGGKRWIMSNFISDDEILPKKKYIQELKKYLKKLEND